MPKASRFFTIEPSQISEVAVRIERRMRRMGLSVSALSEKCSIVASDLFEEDDCPSLSRSRISKILMNRQGSSGRSAAKVITSSELIILARALEVSVEWLSGQKDNEDPIVWNVLAGPERAVNLLHLLEEHEDLAGEITTWSEYLLCSFVTEEFMYAFHEAHFSEVDTFGIGKDKSRLVHFFNMTGKRRRLRAFRLERSFTFRSLVFDSSLRKIAAGTEVYRSISRSARRRCLENLADILTKPAMKMDLVIVDDANVGGLKTALRDYETVGVVGGTFSMWNYHSGSIGWSEHPKYVGYHRNLLSQMQRYALCKGMGETVQYIRRLLSNG